MRQKRKDVYEMMNITIPVKVHLETISNHNGFEAGQLEKAIEQFKENIGAELLHKLLGNHSDFELVQTADVVNYEVLKV